MIIFLNSPIRIKKFFLLIVLSLTSLTTLADEYYEPLYLYKWAGYDPAVLSNKYWSSSTLLRDGIQSYIDSIGGDESLGVMEQTPYWSANGASYLWNAKSYKKSTGELLPGGIGGGERWVFCPAGFALLGGASIGPPQSMGPYSNLVGYCKKVVSSPEPDSSSCGYGNPIYPEAALKVQTEVDYTDKFGLSFVRTYRSDNGKFTHNYEISLQDNSSFGISFDECSQKDSPLRYTDLTNTTKTYCYKKIASGEKTILLNRGGIDKKLTFSSDTKLALTPDNTNTLIKTTDSSGVFNGWKVTNDNDEIEIYSTSGRLLSIKNRSGITVKTFNYNGSQLSSVTDNFGRQLQFSYDGQGRLSQMTDPGGKIYNYEYDNSDNLIKVKYPADSLGVISSRIYHYEDPNKGYLLTGITDENGQRYATFAYDSTGKAISTEHASGVNKYSFSYSQFPSSTTITDPLQTQRTNTYQTIQGVARLKSSSQPCSSCGGNNFSNLTYDTNGNVTSRTDFKGNRTNYTYNLSRNLELTRTEGLTSTGASTISTRTISTQWHATWRLPVSIAEPLKKTTYTYGGDVGVSCGAIGKVCTQTEQATSDANGSQGFSAAAVGTSRTWSFSYNTNGQVLTINGPRTDVNDVTSYTYYTDTTTTHRPGDLATITNPLGHVTTIESYDANGRPTSIYHSNTGTTALSYTARGKLKSISGVGGNATYSYDAAEQLTQVSFNQGRTYTYAYDGAHRLLSITSGTGEKLSYTLDNAGNRLTTILTDANGTVTSQERQVFDTLGQLQQSIATIQGADAATTYTYDANGQLQTETSPLSEVTTYAYDPLNRIKTIQELLNGITLSTQFVKNGQDVTTSVQAPNGALSSNIPNGYGELSSELSPDRGSTNYTYDSAGNIKTRTDARGLTLNYGYDALNRPLTATSPTSTDNITYTYDANTSLVNCSSSGAASRGHLCKVVDASGMTALAYDLQSNLTKIYKQVNGVTYGSQFTYGLQGQSYVAMLPSNRYVYYTRDSEQRIKAINANVNGVDTAVVSNISYRPDGQLKTLTFNNGETLNSSYDAGGNLTLTARSNGNTSESFNRDLDGQLKSRLLSSTNTRSYQYDSLHRLKNESVGTSLLQNFSYDNNGNRLSNGTNTYTYASNSNQLATRNGVAVTRDAAGNYTSNGSGQTYVWNSLGQYTQLNVGGVKKASYTYNYLNQRIQKTLWNGATALTTTVYHYDPKGRLVMETNGTGAVQVVYVYADGYQPLVVIQAANSVYNSTTQDRVLYIQADHLGTPRLATDALKRTVWRWESDAFGTTAPQQDPDGDGVAITLNLRFPSQYYDAESGLHQNWHRSYDPALGRYISSDPIGLAGGLNTFGYANINPITFFDPKGLSVWDVAKIEQQYLHSVDNLENAGFRREGYGTFNMLLNNIPGLATELYNDRYNTNYKSYMRCFMLSERVVQDINEKLTNLDDKWDVRIASRPGHYWVELVSPNLKDPTIHLDPLYRTFKLSNSASIDYTIIKNTNGQGTSNYGTYYLK